MATTLGITGCPTTQNRPGDSLGRIFICISNVWRDVADMYVVVDEAWHQIYSTSIVISGDWELIE